MSDSEDFGLDDGQVADLDYFVGRGLSFDDALMLASNRISRAAAGSTPESVVPFVAAASFQGLNDIDGRLLEANGNPDHAWERWAEEEDSE